MGARSPPRGSAPTCGDYIEVFHDSTRSAKAWGGFSPTCVLGSTGAVPVQVWGGCRSPASQLGSIPSLLHPREVGRTGAKQGFAEGFGMGCMWRCLGQDPGAGSEQPAHSQRTASPMSPNACLEVGMGKAQFYPAYPKDALCGFGGRAAAGCKCPAGRCLFPPCMAVLSNCGFTSV